MSRPSTIPTDDERALRDLVARCEAAWNAGDSVAWAACMAEDVSFTGVLGDRYHGREIVESGHRHIFNTIYKDSKMTVAIEGFRQVRPDVTLVYVHETLRSHLKPETVVSTARQMQVSPEMHDSEIRGTIVAAKDRGHWQIAAFHNTLIAPHAPARK